MENDEMEVRSDREKNILATEDYIHYEHAGQGQRFLNWLIDNILIRLGLSYAVGYCIGLLIGLLNSDTQLEIYSSIVNQSAAFYVVAYLIAALSYILYYTFCEKLFKGYTLGKLITGTRAIRQDGGELTLRNAFLRSLSRIVPFEIFSGFSTLTWHDRWTDTMVIKSR